MAEIIISIIAFLFNVLPIFIIAFIFYKNCYKKCPPDKAIVVYGKTDNPAGVQVITSGGIFVIPIIQDYALLSLKPVTVKIDTSLAFYDGVLTKDNGIINVKAKFKAAVSKNPYTIQNAAERLLGVAENEVINKVNGIILNQLPLVVRNMTKEKVCDKKIFSDRLRASVNGELAKIGMKIISMNIEEITEFSESNENEERISAPDNSFSEEFKQIAKSETENQNKAEQNEIKSEDKSSQEFSFNYNDFSDENIYLEIENAVTKNYEEISLAPQFSVSFPKEVMEEYLGSKEFNEQIKNILTEKTKYAVSAFYFEEIQNNEKEFLKELLKEVNNELNSFELNVKEIKLLGLFNVSEYMKTLDEEDKENDIELTEEISAVQEVQTETKQETEKETIVEEISEQQYSTESTQEKIDDIFASTRKYFEKNNSM